MDGIEKITAKIAADAQAEIDALNARAQAEAKEIADAGRAKADALTAELTEKQRRAIAYSKQGKHGIEIKSHDKMTALKLLGEYLGIFKAKEDIDSLKKMDDILDRIGGNI